MADIKPDIALHLWKEDNHNDHMVASELSRVALRHAARIIGAKLYRPPRAIYSYDNGPGHTIGFEPNTYVDIADEWEEAIEWLGQLNAWVRKEKFEKGVITGSARTKETLARYRGAACRARYAEAVWNPRPVKAEIL